ncbi:class I SAM-dependent methyltransferase [Gluconobacter sp. Dm-62]|nr:class I SAM-dependent methyltransferase [Gluconobacter sp. Dm-62]
MSAIRFFGTASLLVSLLASGQSHAQPDASLSPRLSVPNRTPKFIARDPARHPVQELAFLGLTPTSSVIEIWPGSGYWTEILAPYLHDHGRYALALGDINGSHVEKAFAKPPSFLSQPPAAAPYDRITLTELAQGHDQIGVPGSADIVLTFRNLHNWMQQGDVPEMLAAIHRVLKPGGIFGVEDHRSHLPGLQDPKAKDGYVQQDYAIRLIEAAGFRLVGTSEINANPKDTTNWPKGVWTLPPSLALGDKNRERYIAIGEADNFVLKFVRIGQ